LFWKRFGRVNAADDNVSQKRKRTANTKFFTAPFRKENFAQHVRSQHAAQFEEYSALTFEEKKSFFDTKKRVQDSIHRYMNASRTALMIPLAKDIVVVIIGEMFFKPELDEDDGDDGAHHKDQCSEALSPAAGRVILGQG
jgi:homoserine acetyltransferase